jgi:pimeloyl-ACP methyl ester carboxylesterase
MMALTTDLESWRRAGQKLSYRGHSLFVQVDGKPRADGDAVMLIHGFPTASWDFRHLWPRLAAADRVIALDLLGYGFSDKPRDHAYSVFDHADQVEAALAELGVRRCRILAHDYGDTVAQELLARGVERRASAGVRIDAVCLLNGGLFPEAHRPTAIQRLLASPLGPLVARATNQRAFRKSLAAVFGAATQPSAADLDDAWALVAAGGGTHRIAHRLIGYMEERRRHRARWVQVLAAPPVPIRVINGAADPVSGAHMIVRYREVVRDADVVSLPGVGHYPQLEAPERFPELWPASAGTSV